jgi:hypothetical protein
VEFFDLNTERREDAAMMEYKGYRAAITFDDEAGVFHGEVTGTRDVIIFEGTSVVELRKEFECSIDDYLQAYETRGRTPGRFHFGSHRRSTVQLKRPPRLGGKASTHGLRRR